LGLDVTNTKAWLSLADRLYEKGKAIFDHSDRRESEVGTNDPQVVALTLLARTMGNFQALVLLLEHNHIVEARTLARCCWENFFWISALAKKGDKFIEEMILDDAASRKKRAKGLLEWTCEQDKELEFTPNLQSFYEDLKKEQPKAALITHKKTAEDGTIKHGYLVYAELSNDAAHPSTTSLSRHVTSGGDEAGFTVHARPVNEPGEADDTLELACSALLGVCVAANEVVDGTEGGERLLALSEVFRALSEANKAAREHPVQ
jgi:hypothetical protein